LPAKGGKQTNRQRFGEKRGGCKLPNVALSSKKEKKKKKRGGGGGVTE